MLNGFARAKAPHVLGEPKKSTARVVSWVPSRPLRESWNPARNALDGRICRFTEPNVRTVSQA